MVAGPKAMPSACQPKPLYFAPRQVNLHGDACFFLNCCSPSQRAAGGGQCLWDAKSSDESYAGLRVSVGTGDALGHALFTSMEVSL